MSRSLPFPPPISPRPSSSPHTCYPSPHVIKVRVLAVDVIVVVITAALPLRRSALGLGDRKGRLRKQYIYREDRQMYEEGIDGMVGR